MSAARLGADRARRDRPRKGWRLARADRLPLPVALRHMANAEALLVTDGSGEVADTAEILRLQR